MAPAAQPPRFALALAIELPNVHSPSFGNKTSNLLWGAPSPKALIRMEQSRPGSRGWRRLSLANQAVPSLASDWLRVGRVAQCSSQESAQEDFFEL